MFCSNRVSFSKMSIVAGCFAMLTVWGCYESDLVEFRGTVVAQYGISYNGDTCEAAGVERVVALLDNGRYKAEAKCGDYAIALENVPEGTYDLTLFGYNNRGIPVVDSLEGGPVQVDIIGEQTVDISEPFVLTEAPVRLFLRWTLGWGNCKSRNVGRFKVQVQQDGVNKDLLHVNLPCGLGGTEEGEYRIVPDKHRRLANPFDKIIVQPVRRNGSSFGEFFVVEFTEFTNPGPGGVIPLEIRCGPTFCDGGGGGCD